MQLLVKKGEKVKVVIKIYLLILFASPPKKREKKHAYGKSMHAPTHRAEHHSLGLYSCICASFDLCLSLALPGGMTVSVRRDPATGAMVLQRTLYLLPSMAKVLASPSRPSLAAL